jgi:uracil-DNA glycosylase family 4
MSLPPSPRLDEFLAYLQELGFSELYAHRPSGAVDAKPAAQRGATVRGIAVKPAAARAPIPASPTPGRRSAAAAATERRPRPAELDLALPAGERARRLELLRQAASGCRLCRLARTRQTVVFGSGHADADLLLVGEGPGAEEDAQGVPFVGAAGELLTRILKAIELDRSQVYIANVVKCRPPGNRDPEHDEIHSCLPYLESQIALVRPRLIVCLGRVAACTLLETTASLASLRGQAFAWHGIELRVTYHPAALLRDDSKRRPVWEDMQGIRDRLRELAAQGNKA